MFFPLAYAVAKTPGEGPDFSSMVLSLTFSYLDYMRTSLRLAPPREILMLFNRFFVVLCLTEFPVENGSLNEVTVKSLRTTRFPLRPESMDWLTRLSALPESKLTSTERYMATSLVLGILFASAVACLCRIISLRKKSLLSIWGPSIESLCLLVVVRGKV
jgi:hypothetical protein